MLFSHFDTANIITINDSQHITWLTLLAISMSVIARSSVIYDYVCSILHCVHGIHMYSFFTLPSVNTACSEQVLYALSRLTGAESPDVYIHLYLNHMFVFFIFLQSLTHLISILATYTLLLLAVYNPTLLAIFILQSSCSYKV